MAYSNRYFRRQPSRELGDYLRNLREEKTNLSQAEAARRLGVSDARLNQYEQGSRPPPDLILIKLAQLYRLPPDEVLRRAYWPQLVLLPLVAIIDPGLLSRDLIEELEKGLEEAERQELTRHIEKLLHKRSKVRQR